MPQQPARSIAGQVLNPARSVHVGQNAKDENGASWMMFPEAPSHSDEKGLFDGPSAAKGMNLCTNNYS